MKQTECIIVGCGLAGISMAWKLFQENISFVIIGHTNLSSSSLIAPGIWNPVVFKRITPTWNATELIHQLLPFYQYTEKKLNRSFLKPIKILHVLNNEYEKKLWLPKKELYPRFLGDIKLIDNKEYPLLKTSLTCGIVSNSGRLNVAEYIYYSIEFFKSFNFFSEICFNYDALIIHSDGFEYENIFAKKIIFCEGYLIKNNPWFSFVKLKPAKGEILEIQTEETVLPANTVLHKNISIISTENNKLIIGSNYEWNELNELPSEKIKNFFCSAFENIFNSSYQIIGHYAGIRPAADRRPVLGEHPEIKNMFVLNGLGTKGVMLTPYSVNTLFQLAFNQQKISDELSVNRFCE